MLDDDVSADEDDWLAEVVCEHAGHEWVDAGGGMDLCAVCESQRERPEGGT